MMKKLLFMAVALVAGSSAFAQFDNIGMLGGSTVTGWGSDTDMMTTDGITYTLENVVIVNPGTDAGVKFRKDDAWTVNWGGTGFPTGTGTQDGPNIQVPDGTYNVTFTLGSPVTYSFVAVGETFDEIGLTGMGMTMTMFTTNGVIYTANNVMLGAGNYSFTVNGGASWGNTGFPTGTAVEGVTIPVPMNSYNVSYNAETHVYTFNFVTISLIGAGVVAEDPSWVTDVDFATEDGVNYMLMNYSFPGGEGKFRLNHDWGTSWGSADFPSGSATSDNGPNLVITAGTYDVSFNRESGDFSFDTPTAGTTVFNAATVKVYPNPASNVWNLESALVIDRAELADVTGKIVYTAAVNNAKAAINADAFASGIYFARIYSGSSVEVIKVVKK